MANNFIEGALLGTGKYYRLCCGDNPEPKDMLVYLFKLMGKADIVIPIQKQSEVDGKSFYRRKISNAFTFLVRVISGYDFEYFNGLPLYLRYNVLRWPPVSQGFGFQAEAITRMLDEGASYVKIDKWGDIERKGRKSTALTMRNFLGVAHALLEIGIRRLRKILLGKKLPKAVEIKLGEKD